MQQLLSKSKYLGPGAVDLVEGGVTYPTGPQDGQRQVVPLPSRAVFSTGILLFFFYSFTGVIMDHSVNGSFPVPSASVLPFRTCLLYK